MVQRLITFLYKDDYEPTSIRCLESLKDFNGSAVSEDPALIYHNIFSVASWRAADPFGISIPDNMACACFAQTTAENVAAQVSQPKVWVPPTLLNNTSVLARLENAYQIKNPLTIHATMYALADKYFVEPLAIRAKEKFTSSLADHWDSEDFIAAVQIVYRSTPDRNRLLRDVVFQAFQDYFKVNVSEIPGAEEKLANIDELSFLLMKSWSGRGC